MTDLPLIDRAASLTETEALNLLARRNEAYAEVSALKMLLEKAERREAAAANEAWTLINASSVVGTLGKTIERSKYDTVWTLVDLPQDGQR